MAEKFINRVIISLTFAVIIRSYSQLQVVCDEARNVDPELHRARRNVIESYDAPQNRKVFKYLEKSYDGPQRREEPDANHNSDNGSLIEISEDEDDGESSKIFVVPNAFRDLTPRLCRELQNDLAKNTASFIQCSLLNARPITVCMNCVGPYNTTVYSYHQLMEASENNTKCSDVLVGKDKLEIIETVYGSVAKMWNQGNCNSCYKTDKNGSPDLSAVSNETLDFMQALKKVIDCFEGIKLADGANDTCTECKFLYEQLGSIYDSITKDMVNNQTEVVCADITDSMNVTHHIWNNELKCKLFNTSVGYALCILTGSLSATPILFYLAAKILSNVETIHLVLPKRKKFAQDSTQLQM